MNIYREMAKLPVFSISDVNKYYGNIESARSAVKRMIASSKAIKVRNNLYTCLIDDSDSRHPVADLYEIACAVTQTACISDNSALEYYGFSSKPRYEVYISSMTRFQDFEYDGRILHHVKPRITEGIISPAENSYIRITDKERTVMDILADLDKTITLEELMKAFRHMARSDSFRLREEKLLYYLSLYHNQFLYQKTGYILYYFRSPLGLSFRFFSECHKNIGKSKRYLNSDLIKEINSDRKKKRYRYNSQWGLIVPRHFRMNYVD